MKNNYFFRDKLFFSRQVFAGWIILTVGAILFALVATILSLRLADDTLIIGVSFLVTAPFVVIAHSYLYQHEQKWYMLSEVKRVFYALPEDQVIPFAINELQKIKVRYDQLYRRLMKLKADDQNLFVRLARLRRRFQDTGRKDLIKEIDDIERNVKANYTNVNNQFDTVIEERQKLNSVIAEIRSHDVTPDIVIKNALMLEQQNKEFFHQSDLATQLRQRFNTVRTRA